MPGRVAFDVITPSLAALSVLDGPGCFGVRTHGWPVVHDVGGRWRLRQPMSPDDGWEVETLPGGAPPLAPAPEGLEWAYLTWAEHSRAESGAEILAALPPGRYLLARSDREPQPADRVLLGNEWVPSRPNQRVLYDEPPFYGLVIGPDPDRPPATTAPLVGLVALNYTGGSAVHATLYFTGDPTEAATGDLVLVIPVTGELVVDAMAEFSAERSEQDRQAWRDTGAHALARLLTGTSVRRTVWRG